METYKEENKNIIKKIFIGISISIISTLFFLLIYAFLLAFTNLNENTLTTVVIIVTAISIFIRKFGE